MRCSRGSTRAATARDGPRPNRLSETSTAFWLAAGCPARGSRPTRSARSLSPNASKASASDAAVVADLVAVEAQLPQRAHRAAAKRVGEAAAPASPISFCWSWRNWRRAAAGSAASAAQPPSPIRLPPRKRSERCEAPPPLMARARRWRRRPRSHCPGGRGSTAHRRPVVQRLGEGDGGVVFQRAVVQLQLAEVAGALVGRQRADDAAAPRR